MESREAPELHRKTANQYNHQNLHRNHSIRIFIFLLFNFTMCKSIAQNSAVPPSKSLFQSIQFGSLKCHPSTPFHVVPETTQLNCGKLEDDHMCDRQKQDVFNNLLHSEKFHNPTDLSNLSVRSNRWKMKCLVSPVVERDTWVKMNQDENYFTDL